MILEELTDALAAVALAHGYVFTVLIDSDSDRWHLSIELATVTSDGKPQMVLRLCRPCLDGTQNPPSDHPAGQGIAPLMRS